MNHVESSMHASATANHDRGLRAAASEVLYEFKEFVDTRVQMAVSEFRETMRAIKVGVPILLCAAAFAGTGLLMLTFAAVAIVTVAFAGSPYRWFFAFLIVGVLWVALGARSAFFAYNEFRSQGRFPKKTLQVLKADKSWLQKEARSH